MFLEVAAQTSDHCCGIFHTGEQIRAGQIDVWVVVVVVLVVGVVVVGDSVVVVVPVVALVVVVAVTVVVVVHYSFDKFTFTVRYVHLKWRLLLRYM